MVLREPALDVIDVKGKGVTDDVAAALEPAVDIFL